MSAAQFFSIFRNLLNLKPEQPDSKEIQASFANNQLSMQTEGITPADLEMALLRPQLDPLCGELISRLLSKKLSNFKPLTSTDAQGSLSNQVTPQEYDRWNDLLAKRMSALFKVYRKFALK